MQWNLYDPFRTINLLKNLLGYENETTKANYFAKEIGCPDMDMECMRSKSIKVFAVFSAISSFILQFALVHLVF